MSQAFCRKMERILPQNGKHFAAKWKAFWPKMGCVLAQNVECVPLNADC